MAIWHFIRKVFVSPTFVRFPLQKFSMSWGWWHTPVMPVFGTRSRRIMSSKPPGTTYQELISETKVSWAQWLAFYHSSAHVSFPSWFSLPDFTVSGVYCQVLHFLVALVVFPQWSGSNWLPFCHIFHFITSFRLCPCIPIEWEFRVPSDAYRTC